MKTRLVMLITGFAMLFALMAFPAVTSAYQTPGREQAAPSLVQPLTADSPALTVNVHVAFLTHSYFWLTAINGGGGTADPVHTDRLVSSGLGAWEVWTLEPQGGNVYAIKTANGNYLTATAGGGQTTDAIHTDATAVNGWEKFFLEPQPDGTFAIRTPNGVNYLGAQDGGGHTGDVLHTNSTGVGAWEKFWIVLESPL